MSQYDPLFEPLQLKGLTIRNRFLSTSHSPGLAVGGDITDRYIRYQAEKAKGGVGLTQFGGATAPSTENSFHYGQINGSVDAVIPQYRRMAAAIHEHGAHCTVQLTHGGRRERWDVANWLPTFSSSPLREIIHGSFPVIMEDHDIRRVVRDFASAAVRAREGDLDGVEISCQSATLIEQFWSPAMNQRTDGYGGSLANRMRLGLEILNAVRSAVGDDYVVGIRMPGDEMLKGGLTQDDCLEIAKTYAASGLIDFISVVGAQGVDYQSEARIWPTMWVPSAAYLPIAKVIRDEVSSYVKIFHATRMTDAATAAHALKGGYVDMVGMTRAFLADPHHVNKLKAGDEESIRPCVGAGYCVDRVITGHDAVCAHNVATTREATIPQVISRSPGPKKRVVVVGGGPAGMEAARIAARRGHHVILFEAAPALGGQLLLAAKATWKRDMSGITTWLARQMEVLDVDVRLNAYASEEDVLAENPDVVIAATGGVPHVGSFEGAELATSSWDILSGQASCAAEILLFDESGSVPGLSCAEFAAAQGSKVHLATPDREVGRELGGTNLGAHLTELYKKNVHIITDTRLTRISRSGNRLLAVLTNTYSGHETPLMVDQVIGENGTLPNDELYFTLKPLSGNLGEVDLGALAAARPQDIRNNEAGRFSLFRVGDAWASRNLHASMLDAARIAHPL
ncbi:2,4-dienoyl-CoA reductase-like NADH-dependent reductase (Old Yellow Enzyme family) [Rhodoligotrophos appendicifer]|uniref:oxidoreductase n=1 Tax=Rhodoligotrophos appendicifer TaxID=987056 RepID=UPI001184B344|nr:FAD-dependent oxidoreductase [Rhodoligotrophos appendicifer]